MDFFSLKHEFRDDDAPLVIGEIGVNHNGEIELARRLIDTAVAAGVDVVKFQVFKTEKEISRFAALADYQRENSPEAGSQFDLCKALELPAEAFRTLKDYSAQKGIGFFCSVFDYDSIDFLTDDLGATALKVASGEVTNFPMLRYIAEKKVSVMLSTGGSNLAEVEEAVAVLRRHGCPELVLLHCVSNYPAPLDELNLRAIATLKNRFGVPVGFSDHTEGVDAAIAAVALGAVAIEKHFTLDHSLVGPDHKASAEPAELARLVEGVRAIKLALGDGVKRAMPCELGNIPLIRRSMVANGRLAKGAVLTRDMIDIKRPADGIAPRHLDEVIGRALSRDLEDDQPITWDALS